MSKKILVLAFVLILTLPFFFISISDDPSSLLSQLNPLGHLFFFALLAWLLSRLRPLGRLSFVRQSAAVLLVVLILGGSIELIQPIFERTASWRDLGVNLAGALAGLVFFTPSRVRLNKTALRSAQLLAGGLVMLVLHGPVTTLWDMSVAARQFPVLSDFSTRFEDSRWMYGEYDGNISRSGMGSLKVRLEKERDIGTALFRSLGDWRGYDALTMSVHNPGLNPLIISVVIRDQENRRRGGIREDLFEQTFVLQKGWNDLYIPVEDIMNGPAGRSMELERLTYLVVSGEMLQEPVTIHLDNVRLVHRH